MSKPAIQSQDLNADRAVLRGLDRAVSQGARHRPDLRAAGRAYPADLGSRRAARHPHHRRARRRRRGPHGARPCRAHRPVRRGHGDRRTRRDEHGHRDRQRLARPRAGAADRRLHVAPAGQHGPAAGHPARRHPAPGDAHLAHRARRRTRSCASSTRPWRAPWATLASPGRSISRSRPTCCARTCRRNSCSTNGCKPKPPRAIPPDPAAVKEAVDVFWSAKRPAGHHRPRRAAGRGRARAAARCNRRALSRHAGEPRSRAGRSSLDRGRRARGRDDRGRRRLADRPQARLPGRLRLAGRLSERALHPDRRQRRRADRQSPRPAGAARLAGILRSKPWSKPPAIAKAGIDKAWADGLRKRHRERIAAAESAKDRPTTGSDGKIHPRVDLRRRRRHGADRTTSRSPMAATC